MKIILASSSTYRQKQLQTIIKKFATQSPNTDESPLTNENPDSLALRLACEKAQKVARANPDALIIGSDQVAWLDGKQLSKPGDRSNNIKQLQACQGKTVQFYTGLCMLNSKTGKLQSSVELFETRFRTLAKHQIERYVDAEQAFDCAGGFKVEGLGISLFEELKGTDPNTLIGLPLIKLITFLSNEGVQIP